MKVVLGVSNRHVHLSQEDYQILFKDEELKMEKKLIQPHQFASNQFVTIKTEKSLFENVRLIGPIRSYTQVEISRSDAYQLGINPPIRDSGDLEGSETVEIIGPYGSIKKACCIQANRHIHMTSEQRKKANLEHLSEVSVFFPGEKSTVFHHVKIKEQKESELEIHLDTDDANAALLKTGDMGEIIMTQ